MQLSEDIVAAIASLCGEWNKAEKAIKLAEQINGEIINPSIYELRYGGRRIVEAFALLQAGNVDTARRILHDAEFDCCRARHDAIDAATSKIVSDLDIARHKLGANVIMTTFPDFPALVRDLGEVRDRIARSRENRENRNAIYEAIQNDKLAEIAEKFRMFRASEPLMVEQARSDRKEKIFLRATTFIAILLALLSWLYPRP